MAAVITLALSEDWVFAESGPQVVTLQKGLEHELQLFELHCASAP